MGIEIRLNIPLQKLAGNEERIEVKGSTVRECLDNLIIILPGAEKSLFEKDGSLRPLILINNHHFSQEELDRKVNDGDELWIISKIYGG